MNLNRILDWLDESAAGLIRLAYLFAGITAVAAYFGDGTIPPDITTFFNAILPWVLAFALETHAYLTARRVRSAWQGIQAAAKDTREHQQAVGSMKVNLSILVGLLLFSMLNQLQYLTATWTPPHTALALPLWLAYVIRAVIVPLAFMAAAFLVPVGESLTAQIKAEAHHFAGATFKVARRQWSARLKQMRKSGEDVTGALTNLIEDPDERRVIETIHQAMFTGDQDSQPAQGATTTGPTRRPPTGGSPAAQPRSRSKQQAPRGPQLIHLPDPERPLTIQAHLSPEQRIRRALADHPGASVSDLARIAGVSRNTARRYKTVIEQEHTQPAQIAR